MSAALVSETVNYHRATINMQIPCFNCGADMVTYYGQDMCPDCGECESASIHNHSQTW